MAVSQVRQNYHEEVEAAVNKQINLELHASYVYLSMAYFFDRDDVALPGCHKYFKEESSEENGHAQRLMKYQNQRGGRVVLRDVSRPANNDWTSPLKAFEAALSLEKTVNQSLLDLHQLGGTHNDPQLCDFLESHYLTEQVEAIKKLGDFITQLKRVGTGLGEYIWDKETFE